LDARQNWVSFALLLVTLDTAHSIDDMNIPGFRLDNRGQTTVTDKIQDTRQ